MNQATAEGSDPEGNPVIDFSGTDIDNDEPTITVIESTIPLAEDDSVTTGMKQPVIISILDNDEANDVGFDYSSIEIISYPIHGTITIMPDGTVLYEPRLDVKYSGTDAFTYRVQDGNGKWTNVATVTITIPGLFIPNVITPNGDTKNDTFEIIGLQSYTSAEVLIYNRWGNEVYRNSKYDNTFNGEGLNEGTYYYLVKLTNVNGGVETYQGWIFIKR